MTNIKKQLEKIKKEKRIGLMSHLVIGYPSLRKTVSLAKIMEMAGADLLELQIPFSDPVADGPTIMKACDYSLKRGTQVEDCFAVTKILIKKIKIPLLLMSYYNTLFVYGTERFIKKTKKIGISGLIVPDLPPEEEKEEKFINYCHKYGIHHIRILSPSSTDKRIKKNVKIASGFVYLVSRFGITGVRKTLDPKVRDYIGRIKKHTKLPLAVGFGLSCKEHLKALKGYAEIAVVGSAIIEIIENVELKEAPRSLEKFIKRLREN